MNVNRRRFLQRVGGSLSAVGLLASAGCSSSCPDTGRPSPTDTVSLFDETTGPFETSPSGTWIAPGGNAGHTGHSTHSLPSSPLSVRWRTQLDVPATEGESLSASAPTVVDETVLVADSRRVHALSSRTGESLWQSEQILVTEHDLDWEEHAHTVAPSGSSDGSVYVGTVDGIVALDGRDGTARWDESDMTDVATPTIHEGTVFALGADSLRALDSSGTELWQRTVNRGNRSVSPAVSNGVVAVPADDGVYGFDATSGDDLWHFDRRVDTHAVLENGVCYVGNYDGLHAVSATTGERLWTYSRGDYRALLSPILTPETIYVVEQPGEAGAASFALDRTDGEPSPRWCSYIGSGALTAATDDIALGILSIGEGPNSVEGVVAFAAPLGESLWAIEGGSHPRSWVTPPAVLDSAIVVTTRGGTVAAVGGAS
ncbi:MAG: PQQ-binding-like beta-propeller repeat protein [Halodesulfurarchaeum sp.]